MRWEHKTHTRQRTDITPPSRKARPVTVPPGRGGGRSSELPAPPWPPELPAPPWPPFCLFRSGGPRPVILSVSVLQGLQSGTDRMEAMAELGALEAMAVQGAPKAMAEQGAQEAMAVQGAQEAMAVQGAQEAMAGGLCGRGLVPQPGHSSRNSSTPQKKFHGAATGYQEPSGAKQTGTGHPTGTESPPLAKLGSWGFFWVWQGVRGPHRVPQQALPRQAKLSCHVHWDSSGAGGSSCCGHGGHSWAACPRRVSMDMTRQDALKLFLWAWQDLKSMTLGKWHGTPDHDVWTGSTGSESAAAGGLATWTTGGLATRTAGVLATWTAGRLG